MADALSRIEKRILMEEASSQYILGIFILGAAALNIMEAAAKIPIRIICGSNTLAAGTCQNYLAFGKLAVVVVLYSYCLRRMTKLYFHSPYVRKLLFIWGIVLIPVQLIYDISTLVYNRMLGTIWLIVNSNYDANNDAMYSMFYDSSHGFKYIGMFTAVAIGIIMTGVILERKRLIVISIILMAVFIAIFAAVNINSMNIDVKFMNIGINYTALLFHSLMTIGLLVLGIYIVKSYREKKIEI